MRRSAARTKCPGLVAAGAESTCQVAVGAEPTGRVAAGAESVGSDPVGSELTDSNPTGVNSADEGSITPLAIGFVVIALLLAFLIAALTDLHMARRELQGVADSAALAASDSFEPATGDEPGLVFSPPAAKRAAGRYVAGVPMPKGMHNLRLSADADGEHSVVIRLQADFSPSLLSPFVPDLIDLHATAYARGSLRIS